MQLTSIDFLLWAKQGPEDRALKNINKLLPSWYIQNGKENNEQINMQASTMSNSDTIKNNQAGKRKYIVLGM